MRPDEKTARKEGRKGASVTGAKDAKARRVETGLGDSMSTTGSVSQPKKPKKQDKKPANSKSASNVVTPEDPQVRYTKKKEKEDTVEIVTSPGKDVQQGVRKDADKAKEAAISENEVSKEVGNMKVGSPPQAQAKIRLEPTNQGTPLSMRGGAGATVEEDISEEDLYRGEEEIEKERNKKVAAQPPTQQTRVQDRGSVAEMVNLLSYSEREWRGNTAKSVLIRKGYEAVSQNFVGLRRVRGDNYCALRATLFQVFAQCSQLPSWLSEEDITLWPEKVLAEKELIGQWRFPAECREEHASSGAVEQLKHYLTRLKKRWQEAAQAGSVEGRQQVCAEVFQGEEEEYGLLEAVKFLMLRTAAELHGRMQEGAEVPVFCWLLFARDSSACPRTFLTNHLNHVGFSGGLEQVEMFLLGYALQQTIKVYRLYKADTEEFITYYPDDHKDDWPHVSLVTEDDRHYNVPVSKREELQIPQSTTLG
ncbi:hypothetical protein AGOR_G00040810 [Albula goreensis]|uniref:OTU domain-containing protein n=1 Tax=Albula goreensis TaxID=1534307 RepID=A0A8T3E5B0_9TELE|nr:hypothetical protein AGOR_G00040810 [Albula goreensis]